MSISQQGRGARWAGLAMGVGLAAAFAADGARAEEAEGSWSVTWNNGTQIVSPDKSIDIKIGGFFQVDSLIDRFNNQADNLSGVDDGSGVIFRRARIYSEGTLFEDFFYKAEYDFAGGDAQFKDVYAGIRNLPWGSRLRIGHFKEPFSLEQLTSSKVMTFNERSLTDAFAPARNTGIMWNGTSMDQALTWQTGGFRETNDFGDDFDNNPTYNLTSRITGVPWAEEKDSRLVHLGAAYSHKFTDQDEPLRYRARPGIGTGSRFVDTGNLPVNGVDLIGLEGALVLGPFSLQSEYIYATVDRPAYTPGDVDFWGAYGQVSYFLTGEHRAYKRDMGVFDRVKPNKRFSIKNGDWGAWQVAFRYDTIDLEEKDITGGHQYDLTTALNWYPTSNTRVMANYIWGHRYGDGSVNAAGIRVQLEY